MEDEKQAKLDAEKILRDQKAKRAADALKVSDLDQKLMDSLTSGVPPKMTKEQKRRVDERYHSFLENRFNTKS